MKVDNISNQNKKDSDSNNNREEVLTKQNLPKRSSKYATRSLRWDSLLHATVTEFGTTARNSNQASREDGIRRSEFRFYAQMILGAVKQLYVGGDRHSLEEILRLAQRRLLHLQAELTCNVNPAKQAKLDRDLSQLFREAVESMLETPGYDTEDIYLLVNYACSSCE